MTNIPKEVVITCLHILVAAVLLTLHPTEVSLINPVFPARVLVLLVSMDSTLAKKKRWLNWNT